MSNPRLSFATLLIAGVFAWPLITAAEARYDADSRPLMPIGGYALEDHDLSNGATYAYRPWFENGDWQGDVIQYVVNESGQMTTDVTMTTDPIKADGSLWSARARFREAEGNADYWKSGRKIITASSAGKQIAFRWDTLDRLQREELDPVTASVADATGSYASRILNFIRGDRSQEGATGGLRVRKSLLGDVVGSHPVHVGTPTANYTFSGYAEFKNSNRLRAARIYVGANDGMVHVFSAESGKEVFAYVPSILLPKLKHLAAKPYRHKFYVDGAIATSDAVVDSQWRTLIAGGLGAGGRGLYALDVTAPDLSSESSGTGKDRKLLIEIDGERDKDIGHIYGKPGIAKLPDGKWYIVTGNGFGSVNQSASLVLIELDSGKVSKRPVHSGMNNGLAAVALLDTNYDHVADFAYAGDLAGNLWKFDLADAQAAPIKLHAAGSSHPISAAPEISAHPSGGYLVYFGTGALLESDDVDDLVQQSVIAIWDHPKVHQDASREILKQTLDIVSSEDSRQLRVASRHRPDWSAHKGWQIDLPETGERLIGSPQLRSRRLQFVTTNPVHHGSAWLMQLDWISGGEPEAPAFDVNEDGKLDHQDTVGIAELIPVGVPLGEGSFSQPTFARISHGVDAIYINGLRLGEIIKEDTCSGACDGGIAGGHIDVDMDTVLGGRTDAHVHEYDNKFNVTYVDYLNITPIKGGGLRSIDAVGIGTDRRLIALMANADLSPAAVVTIGQKQRNAIEYQKLIQQKLKSWDRSSPLLDDDGDELSFTLAELMTDPERTLRIGFNSHAILRGGVIPTQTGCVVGAPSITNGRWRNGALTIHVLDVTDPAGFAFKLQDPSDLKASINIDGKLVQLIEDTNNDGIADTEYGGVLADYGVSTNGFVYESTIFWHYRGACYGNVRWEEDVKNAIWNATGDDASGVTDASKLQSQLLKLENERNKAIWELNKLIATTSDTKKIKEKQTQIDKLTIEIDKIRLKLGFDTSESDSDSVSPTIDMSMTITPVRGPNFVPGRRSWIDLIR